MSAPQRNSRLCGVGARPAIVLLLFLLLAAASATLHAQESPAGTIPLPTATPSLSDPTVEVSTATPSSTPTQEPFPAMRRSSGDAQVRISEIMMRPLSVSDADGEWIELYNMGSEPVNLRDWTVSADTTSSSIGVNLSIPANGYIILGVQTSSAHNGGVVVDYQYPALLLLESGTLALRNGAGDLIDSVSWLKDNTEAGKSIERVDDSVPDQWRLAWRPWPGSAGDWGSPRAENVPPPTPTPKPVTPTRTPTSTRTPRPTATPRPSATPKPSATPRATATPRASATPRTTLTPTATATALPAAWSWLDTHSPIWLEEVGWRGGGEEYVVLSNRSQAAVDLGGWMLADATYPGADEGVIVLPARMLQPGEWVIVARSGADFQARWGLLPHIQLVASSAPLPQGTVDKALGRGLFSLNDRGDTLLLLAPDLRIADVVSFGASGDAGDRINLTPRLLAPTNTSLHRLPDAQPPQNADQRDGWLVSAPSPFAPLVEIGAPTAHANPAIGTLWRAYWGNLNAVSNYTPDAVTALPPRWYLRHAAQQGLDFVAFADPAPHNNLWDAPRTLTLLPAWRWQSSDGESAILYDNLAGGFADRWTLLPWLAQRHPLVQWIAGETPALPGVSMVQVKAGTLEQVRTRALALWQNRGAPLLPLVEGWLTGVAAQERAANGLLEALERARGWTASDAGLALSLSVETSSGRVWMGGEVDATNQAVLHVAANHASGAPVQVRVWQNGSVLFEGSLREGDSIATGIVAAPDAWLYATAESGGSLALSAPIHVRSEEGGALILTEALADPHSDWNGDGVVDEGDEFIELYNAGSRPISLAGWKLQDKREALDAGGEYRFDADQVIASGAYLVLWRTQTRTVLNSNDEALFLRSPGGGMASEVWWEETLPPDRSMARVGNAWAFGVLPSPGRAADATGAAQIRSSTQSAPDPDTSASNDSSATGQPAKDSHAWTTGEFVTFVGAVASSEAGRFLLADLIHPSSAPLLVRMLEGVNPSVMEAGEVWSVRGEIVRNADGSSWLLVVNHADLLRVEVK